MKRFLPSAILVLAVFLAVWFALLYRAPPKMGLVFTRADFSDLAGWASEDLTGFSHAFAESCEALLKMPPMKRLPGASVGGYVRDWQPLCKSYPFNVPDAQKSFIESHFQPYRVTASGKASGLFTGYYEPELRGSFTKSDIYSTPLYAKPEDLVMVDLGRFRTDLEGRRVAGRVREGQLLPYEDRRAIEDALNTAHLKPIIYVDDPVGAFFLHIQGSGRVTLPTGERVKVGYAGQNGHPYFAIGRLLVQEGHIKKGAVSLQSIKAWLEANPLDAIRVMQANPSFIFFRLLDGTDGPFGSAGVSLTPGRSLAVDRKYLPLHAPLFLSTHVPTAGVDGVDGRALEAFQHLMMAQDTGGAIGGEVRGDIFFGAGDAAEFKAGHMQSAGRYWLLLPRTLSAGRD